MNKGLLKIALLSVVCASMPVAFTSCKDYDDDIDRLNKEVAENRSAIDNISQKVSQGGVITSVVPAADGNGIVITVENNGRTESFTIKNGENGKDATVWTIDADGYWCENGVRTSYKAVGENGQPGKPGEDGQPGKPGADGKPGDYYKPNAEGYFDLYTWDASKKEYVLSQKNAIKYATGGDGSISAVVTANDVFLYGVDGANGVIVLAKTGALRSLVFKPDFYYQGIEAMDAPTFKFNALKLNPVSADGKNEGDAPTKGGEVSMTPALVANYYLNPSSANTDNIFDLKFITEDLEYTRAASAVTANIFAREAKNGILTVKANLQGDIKAIGADGEGLVTVMALQARLNEKAAATDTVITSDYAAVKASYYTDIDLSVPKGASGVVLDNAANPNHWWTTAKEAIDAPAALQIAWNNSEGLDISKYIQADYTNAKGNHVAWAKPVNEYGFKYEYALVGYIDGNNATSQSAHAALNPSNNAIVRAQMPKNGKAQPWGAEQNEATMGRMPLVRVSLVDTVTASRPVAAVAYVKLEIVAPGDVAPEDAVTPVGFQWDDDYTVSCSQADKEFKLTWSQVEETILAELKMSKATFERNYDLRMKGDAAQQVTVAANNSITDVDEKYWKGIVRKKPDPLLPQGTEVVMWTLGANYVYEYFMYGTNHTSMAVTIVYDGKEGTAYAKSHIAITLTWTPEDLYNHPTASVDDASKIAELWFSYNSGLSASNGGQKQETHLNVEVPGNGATCNYVNNLLYPFVGNKFVGITGLDTNIYSDYKTIQNGFTFANTVAYTNKEVIGISGAKYVLSASSDGKKLLAAHPGSIATQEVATIDKTWVEIDQEYKHTVTFNEESAYAKDLLNYVGLEKDANGTYVPALGKNEALAATIVVNATNGCEKPIYLDNASYNVRFLRPLNIIQHSNPDLIDGEDDGSSLEVAQSLEFMDWRQIKFTASADYVKYYGITGVVVGKLNPATGELDEAVGTDITKYVIANLNGTEQPLSQVLPDIRLTYVSEGAMSLSKIGTLTYRNGGNVLGYPFTIKVPFVVKYKWGYLKLDMVVNIKPTIGQ